VKIAIVGGTGDLGLGLAVRLAKGHDVTIGSRDASRAKEAAAKATGLSGREVAGKENSDAVRHCDAAILAVPDLPPTDLLSGLKNGLAGKLVISPVVPMRLEDGLFSISTPDESAAERVATALQTRVAGAFHTVPAQKLLSLDSELDYDVLVTADARVTYEEAATIVSSVGRLRPLYAGPLKASRIVEAITPTLLNVGRLNKIKAPSIKVV
jgi:8-hydroxy-5-deazaflavin:NADPH oxidoreductase